jgi:hypothetical protein
MRFTMNATLSTRINFAIIDLQAAVRAARNAHGVEEASANAEFGPWFDEMMLWVPVSIVMAGAALEACANELIQDILDGSTRLLLTGDCRSRLEKLKATRLGNATDKYQQLALLFDKRPNSGDLICADSTSQCIILAAGR